MRGQRVEQAWGPIRHCKRSDLGRILEYNTWKRGLMARLQIRVLGSFEVDLDGEPVTEFESDTARAFLAYLAPEPGRRWPRAVVAEMLWPERPEGAALSNLRHVLTVVRRALHQEKSEALWLATDRGSVSLVSSPDIAVDLLELERLARTSAGQRGAANKWQQAVDLWRGPFLDGLQIRAGA